MPHRKLQILAENEVKRSLRRLPEEIRDAAAECRVQFEERAVFDDEELDEDLLGLFEGNNRLDPPPQLPEEMPRIRLFMDNLWDFAEGDERQYREEVRVTYLHELGHYLGWDEEQVAELGLE